MTNISDALQRCHGYGDKLCCYCLPVFFFQISLIRETGAVYLLYNPKNFLCNSSTTNTI